MVLEKVRQVLVRRGDQCDAAVIRSIRPVDGGLVLHFDGIDTREQAETLRGAEIAVPRSVLPKLPAGEHYQHDLAGLCVVDQNGIEIGRVESIADYPSVQCLVVPTEKGSLEIPMLARYVTDLDVDKGRVAVDNLDELL